MSKVSAYEAKTHLPRLLDRVSRGERITITRHGVPVADLVPSGASPVRPVAETIAEIRALRSKHRLDGLSLRELIEEGRK